MGEPLVIEFDDERPTVGNQLQGVLLRLFTAR